MFSRLRVARKATIICKVECEAQNTAPVTVVSEGWFLPQCVTGIEVRCDAVIAEDLVAQSNNNKKKVWLL